MNKRITLFLSALVIAAWAGSVGAQVLPSQKNPALPSPDDVDPALVDLGADFQIRSNCEGCVGVVSYRFYNMQPTATGFIVDVQARAEQEPVGTFGAGGTVSTSMLANIINALTINIGTDSSVVGQMSRANGQCSSTTIGGFLEPNVSTAFQESLNDASANILGHVWTSLIIGFGPNTPFATEASLRQLPTDWDNVFTLTCNATSGNEANAARTGFNSSDYRTTNQLVGAGASQKLAGRFANSMWHFPMDGVPAIIDAEIGNGIVDGEFYVDLTFSEGVYGSTGGSGAVAASALNIFRVDEVVFTNAAAEVASEGTVFTPTSVTRPGGAALVGGDRVIRAHFASSNHPNELSSLAGGSTQTLIAIRPAGTEAIYDANDNQIHGGSDDWYMQVLHDRLAPYISAAEVGPASTYIDLTFSEGVKFARTTNPAPTPADFELTRYIGGGSSSATVTINSIAVLESASSKVRLHIDSTGITSDDRMDIRIAEQVKEPTFPSLASVFTSDPDSVKYDSTFPRTAAPAQIGSLELKGRDTYTIQYTQSYTSAPAIEAILTGNGTVHSGSVLEVAEGDIGDVRGIVIEIRRTESDPATVTLRINRGIGSTNEGVMFRLEGETSDITSPDNASVPVRFADGELEKRVAVRVAGDEGPTGNRQYTIALNPTDAAIQQIGSPSGVRLLIREDDDAVPPVVSDRGSLEIDSFGATEVTLGWQEGTDENNLRYTLVVTDISGGDEPPTSISFIRTPGTSQARVTRTFTRADVVLIPGRTYSLRLSVQDVFDNPTNGIAYTPVMQTMLTAFAAGERDRYVNLTCSGGEFGDGDGDGVPNNIENEIGSDCTDGDISRIGPADASVPTITVDGGMIAAGAQEVLVDGAAYIVVPGTGERTGIDPAAATCAECAEDSVRAYVNTSSCRNNPGQARPGGDGSVCPTSLSSFLNNDPILWVGRDRLGNWISTISTHTVYVAPPVGFDVGVVSVADSEQTSIELPISVAVSSGAGSFSIGSNDLQASEDTLMLNFVDGSSLSRDNHSAQVEVTGITPAITEVNLIATAKVRAPSDDLSAEPLITTEQLNSSGLFSIGNASVMFIARPPETPRTVVASSSFRQTFSALFDDSDGQVFNRPETTSDDISVPGSTTARSGVYISDGSGIMLPSDSPPLSTEVTTAVGVDINIEVGVFDYAIDLSEPGDIAIALLRLSTVVQTPSVVYKYDPLAGSWGVFIATLITDGTPLVEGDTRHDRVYSAPAPGGQCPGLGGSRQPDDDSSGGDHEYAWNLAVLGDNVRVGDECLLMQIQDGSMNDADGAVEGTVFDPSGTVDDDDDDDDRGGGGGGAMSPIWLILLALAMMLPYGLRRRQSSPFISDL